MRVAIAGIPHDRKYYAESAGAVNGAGNVHFGRELFPEPAFGHRDLRAVAKKTDFSPCYFGNFFTHFQQALLAISGGVIYEARFSVQSLKQGAPLRDGFTLGRIRLLRSSARMLMGAHEDFPGLQ